MANSADDLLLVDLDPPIAWITVNRPVAHNALNSDLWRRLAGAVTALGEDPSVRVIVVRGAGQRAFISGADISEFDQVRGDVAAARRYDELSATAWLALESVAKPVIAMINGLCYGGGVSVAATCDLRIATEAARFAIPALRLGLAYPLVAIERLVRIVGSAAASDLLLTGRAIDAAEALHIGLVHRVVPRSRLEHTVRDLATQIASGAPLTLAAHKLAIREVGEAGRPRRIDELTDALRRCFASEDYQEGIRAFLEKRPARFEGR